MKSSPPHRPSELDPPNSSEWHASRAVEAAESRNLLLLALHQIVFRIGWVFKTESVIMPAFLDHVAGAGWIRGCLPVFSRLGQSLPPLFYSAHLDRLKLKKTALTGFTLMMGLPFAILAGVWLADEGRRPAWMPWLFLSLYLLFFVFKGLYQVSFGAVQGKLIRPTRRGSLILLSTFWGTPPAVLAAWWLLPRWLESPEMGYGCVFATTALCFFVSGLVTGLMAEPTDHAQPAGDGSARALASSALRLLARDANLRRLLAIGVLFGSAGMLAPHYQALARERLGLAGRHLMVWVITQSAAVGILSLFVGPMADRRGNRLTLRVMVFASAVAPALAVLVANLPETAGHAFFWLVYAPLGVAPLVFCTMLNYALEICEPEQHAQYQSVVILGTAAPFLLSPTVGWLLDVTSYELIFLAAVVLVFAAGMLTFWLEEPRWPTPPARRLPPQVESPE